MAVTLHTPDTIYSPRHVPSWLLLAAAAGGINGFAFIACEQFVTHVTGTVTRMGLEWPHIGLAAEYAAVLLCFIAGATASTVFIQARANRGKRPRWGTPLVWVAAILAAAAVAGWLGAFGPIGGKHAADEPPLMLLALLAFAMGLQNAAVASTTGMAVRTTHLTGPSTDVGVLLGSAWFAEGDGRRDAFRGAALRAGTILAFMIGAALSLPLARSLDFLALLVPAAFVLVAAALSFIPEWSPSDFPFRSGRPEGPPAAPAPQASAAERA